MTDVTLAHDQADLRRAYLGGGLGAVVSGLVWLTAAVTATVAGTATGYAALFFGGFLIFPLGTLVEKLLFNRGGVRAGNPGGMLVIETLPAMIGVLVIGFLLLDIRPDWVFPLSAIVVGAHYFPFRTAYGDRTYWVLGGLMMAVGFVSLMMGLFSGIVTAFAIAAIEIAFGVWLTMRHIRD